MTRNEIKENVNEIASQFRLGYFNPVVRSEDVAANFGVKVGIVNPENIVRDFPNESVDPSNVVAALSEDRKKVYIAAGKDLFLIRFAIAHELGHILLRHDEQKDGQAVSKFKSIFSNNDFNSDDTLEKEANIFACYLLVPNNSLAKVLPLTNFMVSRTFIINQMTQILQIPNEAVIMRFSLLKEDDPSLWKKYSLSNKLDL